MSFEIHIRSHYLWINVCHVCFDYMRAQKPFSYDVSFKTAYLEMDELEKQNFEMHAILCELFIRRAFPPEIEYPITLFFSIFFKSCLWEFQDRWKQYYFPYGDVFSIQPVVAPQLWRVAFKKVLSAIREIIYYNFWSFNIVNDQKFAKKNILLSRCFYFYSKCYL